MKKRRHYRILFILMAAGLLCSCGTVGEKEEPQTAGTQTEKAEKEDAIVAFGSLSYLGEMTRLVWQKTGREE